MADTIERIDQIAGELSDIEMTLCSKCNSVYQKNLLEQIHNISYKLSEIYNEFCWLEMTE